MDAMVRAPEVIVIPPTKGMLNTRKIRTAAYARVSSDSEDQLNSFMTQMDYYTKYINANPDMEFVDMYADATVIIGLKQNPTIGRRFSPIFSFIEHLSGKYGRCYT